ncbi:hypothetical protein Scep_023960 [Stephania cephalantha]|uniref:Uncharacterized protein n=1 Tax=Stephania cephalantha TaxID=152367 RepID=A0AAP0HXZ3_9MAGN
MILYMTLHREIGRKSVVHSGLSFFGTRTVVVSFKPSGKSLDFIHDEHWLKILFPNWSQQCLKKTEFNPSGPCALSGCI